MEEANKKEKITENKDMGKYDILNIDDVIYQTTIPKKNKEKKSYKPKNPKEIFAFIPGTVIKIFVKKKEKIKKGTKLMTLHAMKMNNEIFSEVDGVIQDVFVKEGDAVNKTQVLIKIK